MKCIICNISDAIKPYELCLPCYKDQAKEEGIYPPAGTADEWDFYRKLMLETNLDTTDEPL